MILPAIRLRHAAFAFFCCLSAGCVAVQTARFDLSTASVPAVPNEGDRYCVVRIDETRAAAADRGQAPPPVHAVQEKLAADHARWFSSGSNAIPVIVKFRSSIPLDMSAGFQFFGLVGFCTLGLVPYTFDKVSMDFSTSFSLGTGKGTAPAAYRGTTTIKAGNHLTVNGATFPKSEGWNPIAPTDPKPRFDQNRERWLDVFCASVALAAQKLAPDERNALRENNEAWWVARKQGKKLNRPVVVVPPGRPGKPKPPDPKPGGPPRHRIVSQTWSATAKEGSIVAAPGPGAGEKELDSWIRDEYLPEYCRTLGVVVDADKPFATPAATIDVKSEPLSGGTFRFDFKLQK